MVRLEYLEGAFKDSYENEFQFLNGAIRINELNHIKAGFLNFNSSMVRLELQVLILLYLTQ